MKSTMQNQGSSGWAPDRFVRCSSIGCKNHDQSIVDIMTVDIMIVDIMIVDIMTLCQKVAHFLHEMHHFFCFTIVLAVQL